MSAAFLSTTILLIVFADVPQDLAKSKYSLVREPEYKTQPKYGLLAFGPRAEQRTWLVLDGERLFLDRNQNGNLTESEEMVVGTVSPPPSHLAHLLEGTRGVEFPRGSKVCSTTDEFTGLILRQRLPKSEALARPRTESEKTTLKLDLEGWLDVIVHRHSQRLGDHVEMGRAVLASTPEAAPVIHFGGPHYLRFDSRCLTPCQPGQEKVLTAILMRPGFGKAFTWMDERLTVQSPHAAIRLETKSGGSTYLNVELSERECFRFQGRFRVPDNVLPGDAEINAWFDEPNHLQVSPLTETLKVVVDDQQ